MNVVCPFGQRTVDKFMFASFMFFFFLTIPISCFRTQYNFKKSRVLWHLLFPKVGQICKKKNCVDPDQTALLSSKTVCLVGGWGR